MIEWKVLNLLMINKVFREYCWKLVVMELILMEGNDWFVLSLELFWVVYELIWS